MSASRLSLGDLPEYVEVKLKNLESQLNLSDKQLSAVREKLLLDMKKGLGKATNPKATVKMIPSYVEALPDGTEKGSFLTLDLGGTNFRVLLVKLIHKAGKPAKIEMDSQIYKMSNDIITGPGTKLFDYIAQCMSEFIKDQKMTGQKFPVGFTFSFPCKQDGVNHASLITWTKGFTASGVVGKDVVKMLDEAVKRRGDLNVEIVAVVNDTVGTMMSCAFDKRNCCVGLIVGTGSNACYMEKKSNIELIADNKGDMCINMEWGAFGDDGALDEFRNEYDETVDKNSLNPGKQRYEKMISGMYLGELVRYILCKCVSERVIFSGNSRAMEILSKPNSFETANVSKVENKTTHGMTAIQNLLAKLDIGAKKIDCEVLARVCRAVSRRAAHLCAAGVAAVAHKIKQNHPEQKHMRITVGVDGTVYKKHPTFKDVMADKVNLLCKDAGVDVDFALSYDGSGKGAALITAVVHRSK